MKKKLIIIFLMSWGNKTNSYKINDEETFERDQALGLIKAGVAKAKVQKQATVLLEEVEEEEKSLLEAETKAKSILAKEHLENQLNSLYEDVVLKEAEISGTVLEPGQILEMVEDLKKRVLPLSEGGDK